LGAKRLILPTDHSPIQWLRRAPELRGQNARWFEVLEEYNYEFVYRKASSHKNADAISRYPQADDVDSNQDADDTDVKCLHDAHCAVVRNIQQSEGQLDQPIVRTAVELGQLQRTDLDIAPLINAIERGENPPKCDEVADWSATSKSLWRQWCRLQMREGVLHRRFESSDARRISWQIVRGFYVKVMNDRP
jgi:hypothetical protein